MKPNLHPYGDGYLAVLPKEMYDDFQKETLWVTDAELIRRSGIPEKIARVALQTLDADRRSTFPQKQRLFGNRRYWPAVKAYFERVGGFQPIGDRRDR